MDWIATLGLALGASWVSGVRLYGMAATLGWCAKLGYVKLPGNLEVLSTDWVLWTATALFVLEFFADKIPYLDTIWDSVHTFIRIPAGAIVASAAFADFDPSIKVAAFLVGGGLAATSHVTKSSVRAVTNASPEPVSNWFLSLVEDVMSAIKTFAAVFAPVLAILLVFAAAGLCLWMLPRLFRSAKNRLTRKNRPASTA